MSDFMPVFEALADAHGHDDLRSIRELTTYSFGLERSEAGGRDASCVTIHWVTAHQLLQGLVAFIAPVSIKLVKIIPKRRSCTSNRNVPLRNEAVSFHCS